MVINLWRQSEAQGFYAKGEGRFGESLLDKVIFLGKRDVKKVRMSQRALQVKRCSTERKYNTLIWSVLGLLKQ